MNDTQLLDEFLHGNPDPETKLLMDARLLIDPGLKDKLLWQENTYALVKAYGRKQLKLEIENVQQRLFSERRFDSFRKKIQILFS